jgi:hypothetical protein
LNQGNEHFVISRTTRLFIRSANRAVDKATEGHGHVAEWQGQSMKSSSIKRDYLYGAGLAAVLLSASISPAFAVSFTDANGNTCDTTQTVAGPGGGTFCPGSTPTKTTISPGGLGQKLAKGILFGPVPYGDTHENNPWLGGSIDDPYFSGSSTHVNSVTTTSTATGAQGQAAGGQITTLSTGADAHVNQKLVDLQNDNQTLTIGAYFDYSSIRADFDALASSASYRRDQYDAGLNATYFYNRSYVSVEAGGLWGSGSTNATGAIGNFSSTGYQAIVKGGHTFALFDDRSFATKPNLITKAPVANPTPTGGTFVGLDLAAFASTYHENIGAFTDSSGFTTGAENLTIWTVGAQATLYAEMRRNGLLWQPYVQLGVSQEVSYSHTLNIIAQAGQSADVLNFAAPGETFGSAKAGLSVLDTNGIRYGIEGSYYRSSGIDSAGGRAYVQFPLLRWLGITG